MDQLINIGRHRNLVHIYQHGWKLFHEPMELKLYVIDMELCGGTLQQYISSKFEGDCVDGLSISEVWNITLQIASGLSFLHAHRLIHCDVKPANGIIL